MNHDTHIPETGKLLLKAIERVGIAHSIATCQQHFRQVTGLQQIRSLMRQVDGVLQHLQLGTVMLCQFHISSSKPFAIHD